MVIKMSGLILDDGIITAGVTSGITSNIDVRLTKDEDDHVLMFTGGYECFEGGDDTDFDFWILGLDNIRLLHQYLGWMIEQHGAAEK